MCALTVIHISQEVEPLLEAACHACARVFPDKPVVAKEGLSPVGRYRCPECFNDFCSECDVFVHDVVHCCPGCGK